MPKASNVQNFLDQWVMARKAKRTGTPADVTISEPEVYTPKRKGAKPELRVWLDNLGATEDGVALQKLPITATQASFFSKHGEAVMSFSAAHEHAYINGLRDAQLAKVLPLMSIIVEKFETFLKAQVQS